MEKADGLDLAEQNGCLSVVKGSEKAKSLRSAAHVRRLNLRRTKNVPAVILEGPPEDKRRRKKVLLSHPRTAMRRNLFLCI